MLYFSHKNFPPKICLIPSTNIFSLILPHSQGDIFGGTLQKFLTETSQKLDCSCVSDHDPTCLRTLSWSSLTLPVGLLAFQRLLKFLRFWLRFFFLFLFFWFFFVLAHKNKSFSFSRSDNAHFLAWVNQFQKNDTNSTHF